MKSLLALVQLFFCAAPALAQPTITAEPAWSPYLVGALIGILVCISLLLANKPIGASSGYATLAGILAKRIAPGKFINMTYFKEHPPAVDWTLIFIGGAIVGSFLAALSGNELTGRFLPPLWVSEFGENSYWLRAGLSLLGGVLLAFGARLAGGCTSGHGISGALQLSVGSWVSLISFFVGGVIVANGMFG